MMVQQSKDVSDTGSDDSEQMSSFGTRNLTVLFISLLLDLVAFTVILPLLPSLLDYYGSHDDEVASSDEWRCYCLYVAGNCTSYYHS